MAAAERQAQGPTNRPVLVSNTAANMIASLHPFDKKEADAALATAKSSVLDPAKAKRIAGVDNAYVARAGKLRVVFRIEGDSVLITSVLVKD